CRGFLDETETLWEDVGDKLFRARVGVGLGEAKRWDVIRVFRGVDWDSAFPGDRMVPALEATLGDLGIDLRSQRNVELDLEDRPNKSPRAFCVPIEVPERVVLVIKPQGGPDDWRALFHEAGHTEHFAHTSPSLSVEERRLGDNAVTEGWAMLLEHLTIDPVWLTRRLDFPRPEEYAAEGATQLLWLVRRYCAKLLYEIEVHRAADRARVRRGSRPRGARRGLDALLLHLLGALALRRHAQGAVVELDRDLSSGFAAGRTRRRASKR